MRRYQEWRLGPGSTVIDQVICQIIKLFLLDLWNSDPDEGKWWSILCQEYLKAKVVCPKESAFDLGETALPMSQKGILEIKINKK